MKKLAFMFCLLSVMVSPGGVAQEEKIDTAVISRIREEGMSRSQVMDILSTLSDVYGPRLSGSPAYRHAADWAVGKLGAIGLADPHLEAWGPFGRGWTLKHYSANVIGRQVFPLISYPKAWSPGTGGSLTRELIYLDARTDSALEKFRGKVKGKFVLLNDPREVKAHFDPEGSRQADSTLLMLANFDPAGGPRRRMGFQMTPEQKANSILEFHKWQLCEKEGAAGVLTVSRGDGGNVFVQQAVVPMHPDTPYVRRISAYNPKAPRILPQVAVGAEHYNRLVRMIQKGEHPRLDLDLDVEFTKEDSCYNIVAEIPGSDLAGEIVMIGGHFDSWHGGTGATDNASGSAVCIEAMRILKALDLKPRRTIRIGLWGGEEQGLLGSKAYVKEHFGEKDPSLPDSIAPVLYKSGAEKFSVYFNNDNGTGKVRGVYLQGNEAARPIFRRWLAPFKSMDAATLTAANTSGTDHLSFDAIGLPGFQFIQDQIEYDTRTHHATMDLYERVQPEDLKQAAVIMAAFAYDAAMSTAKIPRKTVPVRAIQGSR